MLARKLKAAITLLHVKEQASGRDPGQEYIEAARKKLEEEALKLRIFGTRVEVEVKEGKIFKVVEDMVKDKQISLIVIGTHGVKGKDSFFLGSNTYRVVNHMKVPVLAVQEAAAEPAYRRVFMPLDETFHTREKIPYGMLLARSYDAELSITGLQKHHDKDSVHHLQAIVNQAGNYVSEEVNRVTTDIVDSKNYAADTLRVAEEQKADIIVIMSEQEKTLGGLFLGPYAQQVVTAARMPVLIVPPRVSLVMTSVSI